MSNEYTSDSIKILSAINHIKMRKGVYIGDAHDPRQLLSEIFDNAIDEVQAGFSSELIVTVDTNQNLYRVRDFGRGIPHGKKKLENGQEKEVLEVLLTVSNSGGKFDNSSYNYSSGLNGLGITITNALSNMIHIVSYRKTQYVEAYAYGSDKVDLNYGTKLAPDGTMVEFIPNPEMFHTAKIPIEFIKDRCRVASALGFRAKLIVDGEEIDTDASMFDLIKEEDTTVHTYVTISPMEVIATNSEKMKVALRYTSATNDRYFGYTNLLSNYLGGTHIQELSRNIIQVWKEFQDSHKSIAPAVELHPNDYLVGLRGVCAVFISSPEFSSQTKEKLVVNKRYFDELMTLFRKQLTTYLENNIMFAQQLLKRFEEYRIAQNNLLSRKEISSLIRVNNDGEDNIRRRSVVSKLVECTSRKRKDTEMFIVEGNSAMGPYMFTRNKELQAVLPLRGKILNITNKSVKEAIKNAEICDIANAMGCGIGAACDASKSRYERIIISSDADEDGLQINCLVLSVFINLFPDMVKQGRVYVSLPPLYCWGKDAKTFGWANNIEDIPKHIKMESVERFKGLGAMNPDQLKYFLVDPATRNVMKIEFPSDIDEFNRILGSSEGKNVLMRELGIITTE